MDTNIFEMASRKKFRYDYHGSITTEDLWDLNVKELDVIFKALNRKNKPEEEESLLSTEKKKNPELMAKIEIVRYIANVKLVDAETEKKEKARKEEREKIMSIMADKQNEALKNLSIEELSAKLAELGG